MHHLAHPRYTEQTPVGPISHWHHLPHLSVPTGGGADTKVCSKETDCFSSVPTTARQLSQIKQQLNLKVTFKAFFFSLYKLPIVLLL